MRVTRLDHLVLTVKDIEASVAFYQSVLGMKKVIFGNGRVALILAIKKSTYIKRVLNLSLRPP